MGTLINQLQQNQKSEQMANINHYIGSATFDNYGTASIQMSGVTSGATIIVGRKAATQGSPLIFDGNCTTSGTVVVHAWNTNSNAVFTGSVDINIIAIN